VVNISDTKPSPCGFSRIVIIREKSYIDNELTLWYVNTISSYRLVIVYDSRQIIAFIFRDKVFYTEI